MNTTSFFINSDNLAATGFIELVALSASVLIRPKCENKISFAPVLIAYSIVGNAAVIRVSSDIEPSLFKGTLKSTRINTFLSYNWISLIVFLAILNLLIVNRFSISYYTTNN